MIALPLVGRASEWAGKSLRKEGRGLGLHSWRIARDEGLRPLDAHDDREYPKGEWIVAQERQDWWLWTFKAKGFPIDPVRLSVTQSPSLLVGFSTSHAVSHFVIHSVTRSFIYSLN